MNGAELPCGRTMGVEPANMNYKKSTIADQKLVNPQSEEISNSVSGKGKEVAANDTEEELDDFFASLE